MADAVDRTLLEEWRGDPLGFIESVLIDPESGQPFQLLPAERDFLRHAFRRDADGRLLYPELVYSAPKKSGKTTLAALFVLTLLLLYGGAFPEGIIAANSFEQAGARVFLMIRRIIEASPLLRAAAKITEAKITIADATILAIPSDASTAAGSNQNISTFDELWAFDSERSRRLFEELVPPPTRKVACRLTVTYAGYANESILLEELYKRGMALPEVGKSLHAGDGMLMFWSHDVVAPWQTEAWLKDMKKALRPNQFQRMIRNEFVTSESNFVEMQQWDESVDPRLGRMVADRSLATWAACDASTKHDSTALALVSWSKQDQRVILCDHRVFTPSPDRPIDFATSVEQTLLDWHRRFSLRATWFDPFQMAASAQRLTRAGVTMVEYPQTVPNLTAMAENLFALIKGRNFLTYPDDEIRTAVARSVAVEGARGWKIAKEKQSHRIDIVVALGMAALAAVRGQAGYGYVGFLDDRDATTEADARAADHARLRGYLINVAGMPPWLHM